MKSQLSEIAALFIITLLPLGTIGQTLERLKGANPSFAGSTGFYKSSDTLYSTNGTSSGTAGLYKGVYFFEGEGRKLLMPKLGNSYFFYSLNNDGTLSKTDGTLVGTSDIKTKFSASARAAVMQNLLYFPGADNPSGYNNLRYSLWKSDGTTAGTVPVKSTALGINVLFTLGNKLLLNASESSGSTEKIGFELWTSDGTDQGTRLLKDIFPGVNTSGSAPNQSDPKLFNQVGNKAVFVADDDGGGYRMWVTDCTEAGTTLLQSDRTGLSVRYFGINPKDGILYFVRQVPGKQLELWGTDGTPGGTQKVDLGTIQNVSALNYLLTDNGFFYVNGTEIRQITGRQTSLLIDTKPLIGSKLVSSNPLLLGYQKGVFYVAYTGDNRVARIDGTTTGSYLLTNITSGFDYCNLGGRSDINSYQELFFTVNGKAYLHEYPNGTGTLFTRIDQKNSKDVRVEIYNKSSQFDFYPGSVILLNSKYVGMAWEGNYASTYFPLAFDPGTPPTQTCFIKAAVTGNSIYGTGNLPLPCAVNGTTSLSATATDGTAPFNYQWFRNGTAISGATAVTYAAGSIGDYTVQITDGQSCLATSIGRTVIATKPLSVSLNGPDKVCASFLSSTQFGGYLRAGSTDGTAPFTYRWVVDNKPLAATGTDILISQFGVYSLTVTDACSSSVVSKTVTAAGTLDVTVLGSSGGCTGQPAALTAVASGGQELYAYEWALNGTTTVASRTAILPLTAANGTYNLTVSSGYACPAFKSVQKGNSLPITASITGSTTLCTGQPTTLNASLSNGTAPYTYQWKQNGNVVGTNAASLSIASGGTYSLSVTDACSSTIASFSVAESPSPVVSIGGTLTVCSGQATTLTAAVTGGTGAYAYQWRQGGINLSTTTSITAVSGNTYTVSLTDAKGCVAMATATVSVSVCAGATVLLPASGATATSPITLTASTGLTGSAETGATYQWLLNGSAISGATSPTYLATSSGSYAVVITLNGRTVTSTAVGLTINIPLAVEPLSDGQVTVYPNPSSGECWVKFDVVYPQTVGLRLCDALGKSLRHWTIDMTSKQPPVRISLPDAGGLYLLRVETETGVVVKKLERVR